jgi:hypothetical protein
MSTMSTMADELEDLRADCAYPLTWEGVARASSIVGRALTACEACVLVHGFVVVRDWRVPGPGALETGASVPIFGPDGRRLQAPLLGPLSLVDTVRSMLRRALPTLSVGLRVCEPVVLRSLAGGRAQPWHTDVRPSVWRLVEPLVVLVAVMDTMIDVVPHGHAPLRVRLLAGRMLVMRAALAHRGVGFASENVRVHMVALPPEMAGLMDTTHILEDQRVGAPTVVTPVSVLDIAPGL